MSILRLMQPAFTAGELSPSLWARVDLSKYQSGLKVAKNVFVHPHGGVSNRGGLEFIGRTYQSLISRLVPFIFDAETNQTYNLEFSAQRMRVYRAGSPVLTTPKAITGTTSTTPPVLTSAGHGFSNGDEVFISGLVGPTKLNNRSFVVRNAAANTFSLEDLLGQPVNASGFPSYISGGIARRFFELVTPYTSAQVSALVVAQENDVMFITHQSHAPRKLSRLADDNWTIEVLTFLPKMPSPTGLAGVPYFKLKAGTTANINYVVTALNGAGQESAATAPVVVSVQYENEDGRRVRLSWNAVPGAATYRVYRSGTSIGILAETFQDFIELSQTQVTGDGTAVPAAGAVGAPSTPSGLLASIRNGVTYRYKVSAISSDTAEEGLASAHIVMRNDMSYAGNKNTLAWDAVAGASSYAIYRNDNGKYGYIGTSDITTFTDENITPDLSSAPQLAVNPFEGADNYPQCVTFFEQRLAMGGTKKNPSGVWLGQSANYENFASSDPVRASDAITFRIRSKEKNEVRALLETRGLGVFSSAAEFTVSGGSEDVLTPASIVVKKQGNRGASFVQPIAVGDVMLFAQARGGVVRDFSYEFSNDSFVGRDLTVMARHLFGGGREIVAWAYAQSPHSIIWAVFDTGECVSLTYMREHDVWAWTRHETDGVFETVNVVPEDGEDVPYFVVRRLINGVTRRYIERMKPRSFETAEDAFFVDCGLTYAGNPNTMLRGLDHLEGRTVVALADGNVVRDLVVTNGSITLPNAASKVHAGLPYEAMIKTLDIDIGAVRGLGTIQSRYKSVATLTLRVEKTRGIWAGPSETKLTELKQREYENWDEDIRLATGDLEITLTPDWTKGGEMVVKQIDPLPMTILALMPDMAPGG